MLEAFGYGAIGVVVTLLIQGVLAYRLFRAVAKEAVKQEEENSRQALGEIKYFS